MRFDRFGFIPVRRIVPNRTCGRINMILMVVVVVSGSIIPIITKNSTESPVDSLILKEKLKGNDRQRKTKTPLDSFCN